jgi:enoyl-CoA hydratase/carnithine racemase
VRAIVWRAEGGSWSSGRDVGQIGVRTEDIDNLSFIERGQGMMKMLLALDAPIVCALKGWVIGGSFERSLVCDLRIAAEGTRFMLPEVKHGVITDTGGMARLYQMCGHGLTMDLVLTGRTMEADEALRHGIVSRVVPADKLEETALEMARGIAASPAFTVKMARRNMGLLANQMVIDSIAEEATTQTLVFASSDYAEMKAAKSEKREPKYRRR